ncbi:MAG: RDD family protein [Fibrobacteraceae bacterium]|nr:RDD family protein [Fibrobacteraceae bacterium]
MNWFYIDESILSGDRRQGPLDTEELKALQTEGKISNETLVWHKGLDSWIPWKEALSKEEEKQKNDEEILKSTVEALLKERTKETKFYAGFFIRAAAIIIDFFIIAILWEIGSRILGAFSFVNLDLITQASSDFVQKYYESPLSTEMTGNFFNIPGMHILVLLWFVLQTIYFIFFNARFSGTPGKLLFHIKIENADGSSLGIAGAIRRYAFSLLTEATLIFYGIGYILAAIDPQKRALHDFFARTRVIHAPKSDSAK